MNNDKNTWFERFIRAMQRLKRKQSKHWDERRNMRSTKRYADGRQMNAKNRRNMRKRKG